MLKHGRLAVGLLVLAAAIGAGCGGGDAGSGGDPGVRATYDSLLAARDTRLYEVTWLRSELEAVVEKTPYVVLDFERNLLLMKVTGVTFDSLRVSGHDLDLSGADTLGLGKIHRVLAAEVLSARPAKLEADTTVDKAAAILARIVPPRPKPLRMVVHCDDLSVRFTAADVRLWEDLKLFVQRSWGAPPDSLVRGPMTRLDVAIEAQDLSRLEHFMDRRMPMLLRFPAEERAGLMRLRAGR